MANTKGYIDNITVLNTLLEYVSHNDILDYYELTNDVLKVLLAKMAVVHMN